MLTITLRTPTKVPLEVDGILPERVRELSADKIAKLPVQHGNRQVELGEFFTVAGSAADEQLTWQGELTGVHRIGTKMTAGRMVIAGNAGRHVGSEMRGGEILVAGNVSDFVGAEMKAGLIHVRGSAGHLVGAAYRGSLRGMTGGTILIDGNAGNEVAHSQRRGAIAIGGEVGDYAAVNMLAGTLVVGGACGRRPGAGMRRGTLLFLTSRPELLPTFCFGCRYEPTWLPMVAKELARLGFAATAELGRATCDLFHGDLLTGGRGEVVIVA